VFISVIYNKYFLQSSSPSSVVAPMDFDAPAATVAPDFEFEAVAEGLRPRDELPDTGMCVFAAGLDSSFLAALARMELGDAVEADAVLISRSLAAEWVASAATSGG